MRARRTIPSGVGLVLAVLFEASGCMPDTVDVGRDPSGTTAGGNSETGVMSGGAGGEAGAGGCRLDSSGVYTELSLDAYCSRFACPALSDLQNAAEDTCVSLTETTPFTRQTTGCGRIMVQRYGGSASSRYYYDATTGELVGASGALGGAGLTECGTVAYAAGDETGGDSCSDASTCEFCVPDANSPADVQPCERTPPPFAFDPDCDCRLAGGPGTAGPFVCRMPLALMTERLPLNLTCNGTPDDTVERTTCEGGERKLDWRTGAENFYEYVYVDTDVAYVSASGFVADLCGVDTNQPGTVSAGTLPQLACRDACSSCAGDDPTGAPGCETCPADASARELDESLDAYCRGHFCPTSVADAIAHARAACAVAGADAQAALTDCGGKIVVTYDGVALDAVGPAPRGVFTFDEQSKQLVEVVTDNPSGWGACNVERYHGGSSPDVLCQPTVHCDICSDDSCVAP